MRRTAVAVVSTAVQRARGCRSAPRTAVSGAPAAAFRGAATAADDGAFRAAQERVNALPAVDNDTKLKLYALYKQATVGPNTTPRPGASAAGAAGGELSRPLRRFVQTAGSREPVDGRCRQ
jgi:hypothetical protein